MEKERRRKSWRKNEEMMEKELGGERMKKKMEKEGGVKERGKDGERRRG